MDKLVQALYELTKQQVERIESATQEELEGFVDRREILIQQIRNYIEQNPHFDKSAFESKMKDIFTYDKIILKKMRAIQSETQAQMQKTSTAKKQIHAYEPSSYVADGVFFDSKR